MMIHDPPHNGTPDDEADNDRDSNQRRRHERLKTHDVQSLLGEVIDLSPGGMQVHYIGRPALKLNDAFDVVLWHREHEIMASVHVAWTQHLGYNRQLVGLEFVGNGPDSQQLQVLAAEACSEAFTGPECWRAA
jgi:hypothetical protein